VRGLLLGIFGAALASQAWAADAAHGGIVWATFDLIWAVPFVGVLLSIAILPLAAPHFWHHRQGLVAIGWALAFLVPFTVLHGFTAAHYELLH
jgi:hypothetical protein